MIQKKICMLGTFAVGKTSLVRRFVHSIFDEKYHTTVGVKIDKKKVAVNGTDVNLMLWDLYGEDEFQSVRLSYLRGAAGYFIVVDGTRPQTLDRAYALQEMAAKTVGDVPFLVLLNKADLKDEWALTGRQVEEAQEAGWKLMETSAKTGDSVEDAFAKLAQMMVEK